MLLIVWVRWVLVVFVILTVIYIALSLFKRWEERRRLNSEFVSLYPDNEDEDARDDFIQKGMHIYNNSLRRKLLWGVYLVPLATVVLLILLGHLS